MPEFKELSLELNKLRLLYEAQGEDIKKIAEVQSHHAELELPRRNEISAQRLDRF